MKHTRIILIGSLCMICLIAAVMPVAAAPVNGTAWNTNPEHITAMQAFVAYAGAKGQAQMDGAISDIGTISNGAGTSPLSSIESQFYRHRYVSAVDDHRRRDPAGRDAVEVGPHGLHDHGKILAQGYTTAPEKRLGRVSTPRSWHSQRRSRASRTHGGQTARPPAWMSLRQTTSAGPVCFEPDCKRCRCLAGTGVENQIQQEGTALNAALTSRDESAIKAANGDLATLNQQFVSTVKGYRAAHAHRATAATTLTPAAAV